MSKSPVVPKVDLSKMQDQIRRNVALLPGYYVGWINAIEAAHGRAALTGQRFRVSRTRGKVWIVAPR